MKENSEWVDALIAIGANQGSPETAMQFAKEEVARIRDLQLVACSRWHRTAPVGGPSGQPEFLNGAMRVRTQLNSTQLHEQLLAIESGLGRTRIERWGPRSIDLDLILYGASISNHERLTIPHPRMTFRRFVLEPAIEVAPNFVDPRTGITLSGYLEAINDRRDLFRVHGASVDFMRDLANELNIEPTLPRFFLAASAADTSTATIAGDGGVVIRAESIDKAWQVFTERSREHHGTCFLIAPENLWTQSETSASDPKLEIVVQTSAAGPAAESGNVPANLPANLSGPYLGVSSGVIQEVAIEIVAAAEAMQPTVQG